MIRKQLAGVELWHVRDTSSWHKPWADVLPPEEMSKAARFLRTQDQHNFLVCRYILRTALNRINPNVDPRDFRIVADGLGKPKLMWPEMKVYFNIAHSGSYALVGLSPHEGIGVDVELTDRRSDFQKISETVFSAEERRRLVECPHDEIARNFLEIWTLKEAYIKATGMGMRLPLTKISFQISGAERDQIQVSFNHPINDSGKSWQFVLLQNAPNAIVAVALRCYSAQTFTVENSFAA